MIQKIYKSKEPVEILAWYPDRLARNSVDGGQVIYLIDIGKIASLCFPTFWFEPTPQGLFMLQVAFGRSAFGGKSARLKKLALSNDFYEIKSFAEKIGTNRRLLSRKTEFEFVRLFDLIPKYAEKCERSPAKGGASEQTNSPQNPLSFVWSGCRDSNSD